MAVSKQQEEDEECCTSEKTPLIPSTAVSADEDDALLVRMAKPWYPHLDVTRIFCVCLVVIDHGNPRLGEWNTLLGMNWVVQYLYLVCGICWAMSSRNVAGYLKRLMMYVCIGVSINFLAWIIAGKDWKRNFHDVIFQFWFVIGLMAYVLLLAPLKPYAKWVLETSRFRFYSPPGIEADWAVEREAHVQRQRERQFCQCLKGCLVIGGGVLAMCIVSKVAVDPLVSMSPGIVAPLFSRLNMGHGAQFWGIPTNLEQEREFLQNTCTCMQLTFSNLYIVLVFPLCFQEVSLISWWLIFNTYSQRILFNRGESAASERPFHGLDLTMLGLVCYYFGMKHRRALGDVVVRYWFGVLLLCGLLWLPGYHKRFDQRPEQDISQRTRIEMIEAILIICWLLAGERMVDSRIFSDDKMGFMNYWALVVFLVHKAVHILLPTPWNWIVITGLVPVVWLVCRRKS